MATVSTITSTSSDTYLIETVYDDDDDESSYEEYVIEEVIEEEMEVVDMTDKNDDEQKVDALDDVKMAAASTSTTRTREKGIDDSTVVPPSPPNPRFEGFVLGLPPTTTPPSGPALQIDPTPVASPPAPSPSDDDPACMAHVRSTIPLTSPSKQRAKAASSAGLSELSKQLRVLHAKNESQAQDISRLERQLRILADLQGISVRDLRKALEEACASEAFGELQNRVQKLKHELEAATILKQAELGKNTAAPRIADLELRVGELEEINERKDKEIHQLYEQLRQERAKSTRLASENELLKKELEDLMSRYKQEHDRASVLAASFQNEIRKYQEDQTKKMQEQLRLASQRLKQQQEQQMQQQVQQTGGQKESSPQEDRSIAIGYISPEMAAEYERMVLLLKEKDEELRIAQARFNAGEVNWNMKLRDAEEKNRKALMDLQVEYDKLALTVKELEEADGQNGLRLAQYRARFAVQDERIDDLEQQLDSLYTAFTILKEEFDSEHQNHAAMLNNLNDADAEIARQANVLEKQKSERLSLGVGPTRASTNGFSRDDYSVNSVPRMISTPTTQATTPSRRYDLANTATYTSTSTPAYATAQPYTPSTPERSSSTWQLLFPEEADIGSGQHGSWLIHGPLIVESKGMKGMLRKWKTKPSKLYLRGGLYQWEIGSKQRWPIQFGLSKVEFNPNHPLSFIVYLNPNDTMAPVIRAATSSERDYHRWMAALSKATTGEDYTATEHALPPAPGTPRSSRMDITNSPSGLSMRSPSRNNVSFGWLNEFAPTTMENQEAADLERALALSRHQM